MNEHRREILQMLPEEKISTAEAERFLAALDKERPAAEEGPQRRPKFLRAMRERGRLSTSRRSSRRISRS